MYILRISQYEDTYKARTRNLPTDTPSFDAMHCSRVSAPESSSDMLRTNPRREMSASPCAAFRSELRHRQKKRKKDAFRSDSSMYADICM